jgi:hypothetical protein
MIIESKSVIVFELEVIIVVVLEVIIEIIVVVIVIEMLIYVVIIGFRDSMSCYLFATTIEMFIVSTMNTTTTNITLNSQSRRHSHHER